MSMVVLPQAAWCEPRTFHCLPTGRDACCLDSNFGSVREQDPELGWTHNAIPRSCSTLVIWSLSAFFGGMMVVEEVVDLDAIHPVIHNTPERYSTQPRYWVTEERHVLWVGLM